MKYKKLLAGFFISTNLISNIFSFNSFANEIGPGINMQNISVNNTTSHTNTQLNIKPSSTGIKEINENLNLDNIVTSSSLLELGENNIPEEPILKSYHWLHYRFTDTNNSALSSAESINNSYAYSKSGFSRIFISQNSLLPSDRYYVRTYTNKQGWSTFASGNQYTFNNDEEDKVQAIQFRIKGYISTRADIYYKVILNDGTELDWAKNGETTGAIGTDRFIVALRVALWNKEIPFPHKRNILTQSINYDGLYIDENGEINYSTANGEKYTGWAYYLDDQYYFINGIKATGWQYIDGYKFLFNDNGKLDKDLEDNLGLLPNYRIEYNKANRTMYIMAKDGANGYIIPYKTFFTTNGPDTPLGAFKTYIKYRWKFMHDNIYCQFLTRFNGPFLMHSLLYENKADSNHLNSNTYNSMDFAISGGCIRLLSKDAAWIHNNVPLGTIINIFYNPNTNGPVEKGTILKPIPKEQNYDPTDPVMAAYQTQKDIERTKQLEEVKTAAIQAENEAKTSEDTNEKAYY